MDIWLRIEVRTCLAFSCPTFASFVETSCTLCMNSVPFVYCISHAHFIRRWSHPDSRTALLLVRISCSECSDLRINYHVNYRTLSEFYSFCTSTKSVPIIFMMYNLPNCVGLGSKFQPPRTKTVAVVWQGRTFLASPLYMYR